MESMVINIIREMKKLFSPIILVFMVIFPTYSQPHIIKEINNLVDNADMDCYRRMIIADVQDYNKWLTDTLPLCPGWGDFHPWYSPSDIDLSSHESLALVCLEFRDLEDFGYGDTIYDYIKIDSTRCFLLAMHNDKGRIVGLTDFEGRGTYLSINKKDENYSQRVKKYFKNFSRRIKREKPSIYVFLSSFQRMGFVKDDKIYLLDASGRVMDISEIVSQFLNDVRDKDDSNLKFFRKIANKYPTYRERIMFGESFNVEGRSYRLCNSSQ